MIACHLSLKSVVACWSSGAVKVAPFSRLTFAMCLLFSSMYGLKPRLLLLRFPGIATTHIDAGLARSMRSGWLKSSCRTTDVLLGAAAASGEAHDEVG